MCKQIQALTLTHKSYIYISGLLICESNTFLYRIVNHMYVISAIIVTIIPMMIISLSNEIIGLPFYK